MINEIFNGIQGEGKTQGQYRTFIRMNGCNLSCDLCDSKYSWGQGDQHIQMSELNDIHSSVVITGGEPCLKQNWELIHNHIFIKSNVDWIEVETNGTHIPDSFLSRVDLWNISPKPHYWMKKKIEPYECEPFLLTKKTQNQHYCDCFKACFGG